MSATSISNEPAVSAQQSPVAALGPQHNDEVRPRPRSCFAFRTKWFWYSIASCICWTGWAFTARLGSRHMPASTMEFISTFGFALVTMAVAVCSGRQPEQSLAGRSYALVSGILLGVGGVALYEAYRVGHNASVITATSSLYPLVTVVCAVVFMRERLSRLQFCGLLFAIAAIVTLSL
jgi:transporter family protein